jgi:hypothetical protein
MGDPAVDQGGKACSDVRTDSEPSAGRGAV